MTDSDFERLMNAARASLFPDFWHDLLRIVRATGVHPKDVFSGEKPLTNLPESLDDALVRLKGQEWPLVLCEDNHIGLTRAFRLLAVKAGVERGNAIDFESLYQEQP